MNAPFLLVLTGPPGAGKSTTAALVAEHFTPSVVLEGDALWANVVRGFIPPWESAAREQNEVLVRASLAGAARLAGAGYATILSGHVGPSFLPLLREEFASVNVPLIYIVLRPSLEVCLRHCVERQADPRHVGALSDEDVIAQLYRSYSELGEYESHVMESSTLTSEETVALVVSELSTERFVLR